MARDVVPQTVSRGETLGDVSAVRWWVGWRPLESLLVGGAAGLAVGNGLAVLAGVLLGANVLVTMAATTAAGVGAGLLAWLVGTREINAEYEAVIDAFEGGVTGDDEAVTTYALVGDGAGTSPLVDASERYAATFLALGPSSLRAYRGRLDLIGRTPTVEEGVELPYDRIADVTYDGTALVVRTVDGEPIRWRAPSEPTAALADLRSRRVPAADA